MAQPYGLGHILFLVFIFIVTGLLLYFVIKKFDEKQRILTIKIIAGVLLLFAFLSRLAMVLTLSEDKIQPIYFIPNSFCSLTGYTFALAVLLGKKDNIALHCVAYLGILGGLLTIFYPDFLVQEPTIFGFKNITALIYHSLMVILFLIIICTGYMKVTIRKWYALLLGFCCYMTYALFLAQVCDMPYAMYISKPILSDTPLYWYVLAPLAGLIYCGSLGIMYLVRYLIKRNKKEL